MLAITTVVGDYGYLWLAVGVLLLLFRKTRRCGAEERLKAASSIHFWP